MQCTAAVSRFEHRQSEVCYERACKAVSVSSCWPPLHIYMRRPRLHIRNRLSAACRHDLLLFYATLLLRIHAVHKAGAQASALMMFEQEYPNFRQVLMWTSQASMRSPTAVHIYETILWRGMHFFKGRMSITLRLKFVQVSFEQHALSLMAKCEASCLLALRSTCMP